MTSVPAPRPRKGARLLGAFLLALALPLAAHAAAPESGPLPWRVGGRVGFTVDAASFADSAGPTLEVYVRVPPSTLTALGRDSTGTGRIRLTAHLRGAFGRGHSQDQVQEFAMVPGDSAGGFGKVLVLRFPAGSGRHRLQVRLDDVLSHKRGLIFAGQDAPETEHLEGEVTVPPVEAGRGLSDIEFVWAERAGGGSNAFARGGFTRLPNPERLYGLYASELRATFSARAREARPWHWTARVLDPGGQVVAVRESTKVAAPDLEGEVAIDVATVAAGGYELELRVGQEGDAAPLVRRGRFSVAWQVGSWLRNPRDVEDDVHFLLNADDEEIFTQLSPGEQERFLDAFWKERDPTPGTGRNEARDVFLQRVDYANRHYSHPALGKGMFSDMGRVYIRYGEPSEVVNQVIPTGDNTMDQMIAQLSTEEDRALGDINQKGPGGDQRAFELWIYEGPIGLPPDADPKAGDHPRRKRLVFLFVDDHGMGDFRLRYSTE